MATITCPHCRHDFATQRGPGTQVFCPKCLKYFAVPVSASAPIAAIPPAPTPSSAPLLSTEITLPKSMPQISSAALLEATPPPPPRQPPARKKAMEPVVTLPQIRRPRSSRWILLVVTACVLIVAGVGIALVQPFAAPKNVPNPTGTQVTKANVDVPRFDLVPDVPQRVEPAAPVPVNIPAPPPRVQAPAPPEEVPEPQAPAVPARPAAADAPPAFEIPPLNKKYMPVVTAFQKQIDAAIARGVVYLKKNNVSHVMLKGRADQHRLGYAALTGLTLLECKVPASDEEVQKLAKWVRMDAADDHRTYELALSILFLDRLGDSRDRALIQRMGLVLIGGQNATGGWTYHNQTLTKDESKVLLAFLNQFRRDNADDKMLGAKPDPLNPLATSKSPLNPLDSTKPIPTALPKDPSALPTGLPSEIKSPSSGETDTKITTSLDVPPILPKPAEAKPAEAKEPLLRPKVRADSLPAKLRTIPAVVNDVAPKTAKPKGRTPFVRGGPSGDNSNTQFAMLGLWAARRHGVPSDRALLVADKRFATSQNEDGGWGYILDTPTTKTMNCVGLMGLAMGHGAGLSANPNLDPKTAKNKLPPDVQIQKGLAALGQHIGEPVRNPAETTMQNLYFLWSVERVAMLYDLKTIGGKDWYGWGAQILVQHQKEEGSWDSARYPGAAPTVDTCFALLFLKRSNLVQDLSDNLRILIPITDPFSSMSNK